MRKEAIKGFLKPDWRKASVLVILVSVALAGHVQSWVFSGKNMGLPKPPLFDLLEPFPFWVLWVTLLLPLAMLSNIVVALGGYNADFIMRGPFWSFWVIQIAYFYLVACVTISVWRRLSRE